MKKISKKQKLIVGIAILLIAIILAIIITINTLQNPSNDKIMQEGYLGTTSNAGSSLIARYIKEGVKIGGITGTFKTLDTSDANATAEDILVGKTAYVDGKKLWAYMQKRQIKSILKFIMTLQTKQQILTVLILNIYQMEI